MHLPGFKYGRISGCYRFPVLLTVANAEQMLHVTRQITTKIFECLKGLNSHCESIWTTDR
jgi:hypothetical protein